MEHIAALLLVVGCSGNMAECRELPAPAPIYETFEECEAEKPISLRELEGEAPRDGNVRLCGSCTRLR